MNKFSDASPDGLVEGVGQELEPCTQQSSSPIQPKNGQWVFRFNHSDAKWLHVNVEVVFGSPFPVICQLCSKMDEYQVESLRDWLSRILDVMKPTGR